MKLVRHWILSHLAVSGVVYVLRGQVDAAVQAVAQAFWWMFP